MSRMTILQNKKSQRGLTMVETLSAVILGIIIVIGGLTLYNNANAKRQDQNFLKDLGGLRAHAFDIYYTKYSYGQDGDDLTDRFIMQGAFPKAMIDTDGTIFTPYHTDSTIRIEVLGNTGQFITVIVDKIPKQNCINLINIDRSGYDAVGINDIDPQANIGTVTHNPTADVAAEECTDDNELYYLIKNR